MSRRNWSRRLRARWRRTGSGAEEQSSCPLLLQAFADQRAEAGCRRTLRTQLLHRRITCCLQCSEFISPFVVGANSIDPVIVLPGYEYAAVPGEIEAVSEFIEFGHTTVDPNVGRDGSDCEPHALLVANIWVGSMNAASGKDNELAGLHLHVRNLFVIGIPVRVDLTFAVIVTEERVLLSAVVEGKSRPLVVPPRPVAAWDQLHAPVLSAGLGKGDPGGEFHGRVLRLDRRFEHTRSVLTDRECFDLMPPGARVARILGEDLRSPAQYIVTDQRLHPAYDRWLADDAAQTRDIKVTIVVHGVVENCPGGLFRVKHQRSLLLPEGAHHLGFPQLERANETLLLEGAAVVVNIHGLNHLTHGLKHLSRLVREPRRWPEPAWSHPARAGCPCDPLAPGGSAGGRPSPPATERRERPGRQAGWRRP